MSDQTCSSSVKSKKYSIWNWNTREIFSNLIQRDNVQVSADENNDQSDEESEPESENGEDSNDDTQESDISVNSDASSDSGDENNSVPAIGTTRKQWTKTSSQKKANGENPPPPKKWPIIRRKDCTSAYAKCFMQCLCWLKL